MPRWIGKLTRFAAGVPAWPVSSTTARWRCSHTPSRSGQIRKHHAFALDSSVIKNTQVTERLRIQFRAEAFNLFNHNYFGRDNFNTDPNNPNFGTVFPALVSMQNSNPRQVQLGIKAYW